MSMFTILVAKQEANLSFYAKKNFGLFRLLKMVRLTVLDSGRYEKFQKDKNPLIVSYSFENTPFGTCVIGLLENKVCHLSFTDDFERRFESLKKEWPDASFVKDSETCKSAIEKIFEDDTEMDVIVMGTLFQGKVWNALLEIKKGETRFYGDVASAIGCPSATRAVANAIAKNPVSYLIPCHRVISKNGDVYKYSGGCLVKKKLLKSEGFQD